MSKISTVKAFISLLAITVLAAPATSSTDSFVFGGCSQLKFTPGSPYESNVNLLLTSLVNSATLTTYSNFTVKSPTSQDTLYGLFQCRGDLSNGDCGRCVARAVSQLGTLCLDSSGGALQLEGRDAMLDYLGTGDGSYKPFRVGGVGGVSSVAQCVQDLSASECQDCLSEAIGRLKTVCGAAAWGDLYLAKCYVRFSKAGAYSQDGNGNGNGNGKQ
ncbi:hypothetical protein OIU74_018135 [Salix koriyanagi]|uniref:Gnk2-homologous domain-containing protein n=1 Tax=Salix koriyanagi TaxID=2511006 RepID=A0A9Q0WQW7_9ROSI|nr:hypothetical protein OIU74_018135 [Salix koriyanagi]